LSSDPIGKLEPTLSDGPAEMGRPLFHALIRRGPYGVAQVPAIPILSLLLTGSLLGQAQSPAKPKPRVIVIGVTTDELEIINNALNEVCNGSLSVCAWV